MIYKNGDQGLPGETMKKIGIIICHRYGTCGGGKCFRALRERVGGFAVYSPEESLEVVGYSTCGGCPGGNVEYVPEEMIANGAEVIHLATGLVVGYPPCPRLGFFREYIETAYRIPVVIGTHPIPEKYLRNHRLLPAWKNGKLKGLIGDLMNESLAVMKAYN
jgi:predicted metal-binding protein